MPHLEYCCWHGSQDPFFQEVLSYLNYVFCLDVKITTSQGSEDQFIILHLC